MSTPWNVRIAAGFGAILVLTGALALVLPASASPMSSAVPYDLFHIAFGLVGLGCGLSRRLSLARAFNGGFGAIDLYQAVASLAGWWPTALFRYRLADDVMHVALGLALVAVALRADHPDDPNVVS
jgi:hypothetical protein